MNSGPGSQLFFAVVLVATFAAAAAHAQTQTQAATTPAATAPSAEPPKPRPPLKLRLNDADLRSLTPPSDSEKKSDSGLPTLGGKPSPNLERKPSEVVPKDQSLGM